jgi:hypothetical protein
MRAKTEEEKPLSRPQRRLLRRIYNGRTTPIVADGRPFLTYKDASRYLRSLPVEDREAACSQSTMRAVRGNWIRRAGCRIEPRVLNMIA